MRYRVNDNARVIGRRLILKGFLKTNSQGNRVYDSAGLSPCIVANPAGGHKPLYVSETNSLRYRKITPIECERLQTVPDNYTNHVSNTQRYKMLGNGWTVDVIAHILAAGNFK